MSTLAIPPRAKLICSIFAGDGSRIERSVEALESLWGPADWRSSVMPFDRTSYYDREFGGGLRRQFVSFARLVGQDLLVDIKHEAARLEGEFTRNGRRLVNIDPGVLTAERLVLATGKNFTHRIYLGRGVFADLTLIFQRGSYRPLPWTYPDYASPAVVELWNVLRKRYLIDLAGPGGGQWGVME